jgi:RNA polymerase sigma factor (sigma-70 family)
LCRAHGPLLFYVASRKFNVPSVDCEPLLQEALLSYFTTSSRVDDPKAWLVAAVCNASRHYWRRRARQEHVEGKSINDLVSHPEVANFEQVERKILVRFLLERLRPRQREVLRLHYFEGLTAPEIANKLDTTPAYAGKLIGKALARVRALYREWHQPHHVGPSRPDGPGSLNG